MNAENCQENENLNILWLIWKDAKMTINDIT